MTDRRAIGVLVLVSALLMLPALWTTPMVHDSWWIDIVWADQFTEALRQGTLYPRWLPHSFEGLGAPVFYFYPPAAFYLVSLFGLAGLSAYPALLAAYFTISTGGAKPYRLKVRSPCFSNLSALKSMTVGSYIADAVIILGSIDIVLCEVDR